jgi:hypothetical protein
LIGLTTLTTNGRPLVSPKLNRRRALIVLSKIDEILAWEKNHAQERDLRFVDLGRYLCEVRAGQYWRLDNLGSFDQLPVIEQALETAALMLGTDKSRGYCLEMICADFLAGANMENGNPNGLLVSIDRLFKLLPSPQREEFLNALRAAS